MTAEKMAVSSDFWKVVAKAEKKEYQKVALMVASTVATMVV